MASGHSARLEPGPSGGAVLAKPLHLQRLERSLKLDSFLRQTAAVFNTDVTSDDSEESDCLDSGLSLDSGPNSALKPEPCEQSDASEGKAPRNGVLLHKDQKADKASLYNFSKLKKNRKWLKSLLLSDDTTDSDSDSDDSDFSLSKDELHDMLRLHRFSRQHQSRFHSDRELHQYQFYSTGLLSTHDPFYEQQRHLLGPKKKKIKDEKKFKAKLKRVKKKRKRGDGDALDDEHPFASKVFAKFSHDAPLPPVKKKHLTPEQLTARRRKVWLTIAKKEVPKTFKQKTSAKNLVLTNAKKLAHQCMREVRRAAIQAQKNCKETLPRARRLTKEMMLYWKKYDKVEKEHRKRAEKEALEQRKLDEEMREAKRQQRKLNFLITQTELYAHFMGGKGPGAEGQDEILQKLEDGAAQRQISIGGGVTVNMGHEDYGTAHVFRVITFKVQIDGFTAHVAGITGSIGMKLTLRDNIWGPFLIISPASTLNNWHQEFSRFVPKFKVLPYWGNPHDRKVIRKFWSQKTLYTQNAPFHVVITSYQLVVQDVKYFQRVKWQYMVLDEAQALKSSSSVRWKILLQFQCRNRLLLTGTPIQNTMAELWALLHFIMPTLFDSHDEFNEWFSKDIESHAENKSAIDENQLSRLHMILKPFMLRRIKKDVENELSDKIEILTYCQLTSRQRLLYKALRNKISIEDLLQSSMGTAQQSHTTTSSLMNLVMQFRKVCNHPDLFERQDTRSPFHMALRPYVMSKFLFRRGLLQNLTHNKILQVLLSPFSPQNIQQSLFHRKEEDGGSCFSFLRFIDVSPAQMSNLMLQGTLARWLALFLSLKSAYRLHHQRLFEETGRAAEELADAPEAPKRLSRKDLILWMDKAGAFPNTSSSPVLQDLVFTASSPGLIGHSDVVVHSRSSSRFSLRPCQPALPPKFLLVATPRVTAVPMERYCNDRSAEYDWRVTRGGGGAVYRDCFLFGAPQLASDWTARATSFYPQSPGGVMAISPRHGWSYIRIPDKESLITESGKLHSLDLLLCRLKAQGHRVLIYSQMTRMIDLLEEYMVYRKHTYMRLDGSSKISERRDMVADFQSRTDIFVFLLSTRAGGLGINLTAADTVIFYDSDWNPTVDQQAMDRAHRLGQTKQVTVYRLICQGTIEERILQRAKEKSEIQRVVISGGNFKPDTLKPKEVVSLLLDDDELEKKLRQRQEEKRMQEESSKVKERKRKRDKYAEKKKIEETETKRKKEVNLVISHAPSAPSADNSNMSADGDDSFLSVDMDSALPSPFSEISLSSELQPGSLPPDADQDESSSDMLVIVDEPLPSAPPTRATNSPASVSGSASDNFNGVCSSDFSPGRGRSKGGRGRPKGSGGGAKAGVKSRGRKSTAGSAAAMAGAMAGAAAASAAAYAAYGFSVSKGGLPASSPLQPALGRSGASPAFKPGRSSSPQAKGSSSSMPSPHKHQPPSHYSSHHHQAGAPPGAVRKAKGPPAPGTR
ncbi:chromatin-remodeling ATPase INO80 [Eucyclogobius newberryi]|uniref:chromatin-remodeling ATPase INO80 n=1 Tax=Eucyclogobius newberryi TaxID=166745 RepID=UPI003B58C9C6